MAVVLIAFGVLVGILFFKILKNTVVCQKLGKTLVFLLCIVTGVFLSMNMTVVFVALCCILVAFYIAKSYFKKANAKK